MKKILSYPLSIVYYFFFGLTLVIFHPIQWLCYNLFGYKAHKISVDLLQFCLMRCLNLLGVSIVFNNPYNLPKDRPLIVVSNHQSMYDIPPLIWYLRAHHPKFISKKELGRGIPSVSYNLRHGGSVLIDRRDSVKSITAIEEFAQRVKANNWTAVIFPEGTRSKDGKPKPFKTKGLMTLIKHIPNALIVPLSIKNSWKTVRYGMFPMGIGIRVKITVHKPFETSDSPHKTLIAEVEQLISKNV